MANGVIARMLRLHCLLSGEIKVVTDSTTVEGGTFENILILTRSFTTRTGGASCGKGLAFVLNSCKWKWGKFKENNMTDDKHILQTIRFIHARNTYIELQQQPY